MSKEAMKLALDALEALVERATPWDGLAWVNGREAITALKALAEQPAQQEPMRLQCTTCGTVYADGVPPQVAQPAREWVGLTDEEFEDIEIVCRSTPFGKIEAMQKVEAKLREKNT